MSEIPIRDKTGIINYTLVSEEDYLELNKLKWNLDKDGYAKSGKIRIHRYIMINILKNIIPEKHVVDHIDNNKLNNRRNNLRILSASENSRNKKKKENCTSEYNGVCFNNEKWQVSIRIKDIQRLRAYYLNEIHAAHQYNLWIDEFNITSINKNDVEVPNDFIKWTSKRLNKKGDNLPQGIELKPSGNYYAIMNYDKMRFPLGTYKYLEDAIKIRKHAEKVRDEYFQEKLLNIPTLFNKNGEPIFIVKDSEIIIDKELYYDIIKYAWHFRGKYLRGEINGKKIGLTNYIMNYYDDLYIDHINGNPYDNRKDNLRIVTPHQNSMNNSKQKNCSSQYIGVCKIKYNTWTASITFNGDTIKIGTFKNEIEAAKRRDIATKTYFGEYGKLNFM